MKLPSLEGTLVLCVTILNVPSSIKWLFQAACLCTPFCDSVIRFLPLLLPWSLISLKNKRIVALKSFESFPKVSLANYYVRLSVSLLGNISKKHAILKLLFVKSTNRLKWKMIIDRYSPNSLVGFDFSKTFQTLWTIVQTRYRPSLSS